MKRLSAWLRSWRDRVAPKPEGRPLPPPLALERSLDAAYAIGDPTFLVPLERCHYPYGFGYGPHRWHPFVATLREYLARERSYEDSLLARYYARFQPKNMLELFLPPAVAQRRADSPLAGYEPRRHMPFLPWDLEVHEARGEEGYAAEHGHQAFGPVSPAKGRHEFGRLVLCLQALHRHGYRPRPGDEIRGYFLVSGDDYRFILRSGLHRSAALAALGHEAVQVKFHPAHPRAIHASSLPHWPLVRRGTYPAPEARAFLERFFGEVDGLEHHLQALVEAEGGPEERRVVPSAPDLTAP